MNLQNKKVGIYWDDVHVYHDGDIYGLSKIYTEGIVTIANKEYIIVKNPESIVLNTKKIKNHPSKIPLFYYLPRCIITDIVIYGDK